MHMHGTKCWTLGAFIHHPQKLGDSVAYLWTQGRVSWTQGRVSYVSCGYPTILDRSQFKEISAGSKVTVEPV
eukprot:6336567-Amphidinium_carterae.1